MLCEECNSFIGFNEAIYWSILRGIKAGTILEKEGGGGQGHINHYSFGLHPL